MKTILGWLLWIFSSKIAKEINVLVPQNHIPCQPHTRSYFYVGGSYLEISPNFHISSGQIYVEHLVPVKVTERHPVVMIPGNGMTGANFLNTPDGRPGWANYFINQGYEVYLVDQASRGRSPWHHSTDGKQTIFSALRIEQRFTATKRFRLWPNAHLHTQWPGNGSMGDSTFDNFYAAIVPGLLSAAEASQKTHAGLVSLLDKIGRPVTLLTHSQSGQYAWSVADARPALVKAIIALEPMGPPFMNVIFPPFTPARPYGLTEIPVTYYPSIISASDLSTATVSSTVNDTCILQAAPARKLANLGNTPVLMITSESGYHSHYDVCTADFLEQAGVSVTHVALEKKGIKGNGHMMFMEKNSIDIADVVQAWLTKI